MNKMSTSKKLTFSIIVAVLLSVCLCITTFALIYSIVSVNNNLFHTGAVEINLNDGKAIIDAREFIFEPGMTVKKTFFIENGSTWSVYYKLYFDNVSGGLADTLEITITDGSEVLYSGTASSLNRQSVGAADDVLKINERRELTIYFHMPESSGNGAQAQSLTFSLCADAVQTRNNPYKLFF